MVAQRSDEVGGEVWCGGGGVGGVVVLLMHVRVRPQRALQPVHASPDPTESSSPARRSGKPRKTKGASKRASRGGARPSRRPIELERQVMDGLRWAGGGLGGD